MNIELTKEQAEEFQATADWGAVSVGRISRR